MNPSESKAKRVFEEALQVKDSVQRRALLDQACAGNSALRQEVESLLEAYERAGNFMTLRIPLPAPDFLFERPGTVIGRYKLLEKIGEGGFGVVYMAEQLEPIERKVALKIIKAGMDTRAVIARFEAERQALALMEHPNIARVLDGGATETGRPYFVMELVKGIPITEFCDLEKVSTIGRLKLFINVCHAVQHAHQKGIIHRDLKPSNVLVTLHDGEPVPKVIDFGVAKALGQKLTDKTLFTGFAQMLGTPAYMSPEQAELSGLDIDTRSDVYSLGVLLYELLTGVTPFDKQKLAEAALDEIRRIIRETEPPKPSTRVRTLGEKLGEVARHRNLEPTTLTRALRGDLDWIVMKCLEKDRSRRYETANNLARDIEHHLRHEPVRAAAPTFIYRLSRFARRHRTALGTAVAFGLILVAATVVSLWEASRAQKSAAVAAQQAERASRLALEEAQSRQQALGNARQSHDRLVRINVANGNLLLDNGDYFGALAWFAEALELERDAPERMARERFRLTATIKQSPRLLQMWFHGGAVNTAEFSPDGNFILTASADRTARVWETVTGQPVTPPLRHAGSVTCARFSPDGSLVVTAAADNARLWNARTGQQIFTLDHERLEDALFSPNGKWVATASYNGNAKVWEAATGRLALPPLVHRASGRATQHVAVLAFSPDSKRLVTAAYDNQARIWDVETGALLRSLNENMGVRYAAFSINGSQVATANWAGAAHLWDASTGQMLAPTLAHQGMVDHVSFSPNGEFVATSSIDGTAKLWSTESRTLLRTYPETRNFVLAATFSADSRQLLLRFFNGQVQAWSAQNTRSLCPPLPNASWPTAAQFHPDGRRVLSAGVDGVVRLWDLQPEGLWCRPWTNPAMSIFAVSPSGNRIVTETPLHLQLWDTGSWRSHQLELKLDYPVLQSLFSADEQWLLTAEWISAESGPDNLALQFTTWDLRSGKPLRRTRASTVAAIANRLVFSTTPDLSQVAFGPDRVAEAWDLVRGVRLWRSKAHATPLSVVRYSPDATRLAINCGRLVHLLDSATGEPVGPALTNKLLIRCADFQPNGKLIAAACADDSYANGEARVWETATGKLLLALEHKDGVTAVAFSPDGTRLATGTESSVARIFELSTGRPLTPYMRHADQVIALAFSPDGRLLATSTTGSNLRVWDASTGEPLTPPLKLSNAADRVAFVAGGKYAAAKTSRSWELFRLELDQAPVDDLLALARLLSGQHIDATGVAEPLEVSILSNSWTRLHRSLPEFFAWTPSLRDSSPAAYVQPPHVPASVPTRDPNTCSNALALDNFYNAALDENMMDDPGNQFLSLPRGRQTFAGIEFDVRGVIQLSGTECMKRVGERYPVAIKNIPVNRRCARLHFLLGTEWNETDGTKIGALKIDYDNSAPVELPLVFGEDVRDWWCGPGDDPTLDLANATVVWTGENPATKRSNAVLRLYKRTWANPRPDLVVKSIDFSSAMTRCAPFIVAVTVE